MCRATKAAAPAMASLAMALRTTTVVTKVTAAASGQIGTRLMPQKRPVRASKRLRRSPYLRGV